MSKHDGRIESKDDFIDKSTAQILLLLAYNLRPDPEEFVNGVISILRTNLNELIEYLKELHDLYDL